MEDILHHLGAEKSCAYCGRGYRRWCKISCTHSRVLGFRWRGTDSGVRLEFKSSKFGARKVQELRVKVV